MSDNLPETPSHQERRRRWLIACSGKERFENRGIAESVARRMRSYGRDRKGKISTYKCTGCGKYHIGSRR